MLIDHEYHTSDYMIFHKYENGKNRKIYKLPYYPDRIVHWAIIQVIEPYLIRNLIYDTYSAIPKRGMHLGLERIRKAIRHDEKGCQYCLKMDLRHYYQSINHEILKRKYRKLFKDPELLYLLDEIIDSVATADDEDLYKTYVVLLEEDIDPNTGEPIGNYLSQYSGNFYLSDFDHYIKEKLRVKHYYRYMDDIVILGETKDYLRDVYVKLRRYLKDELKLRVKGNYQIFPTYIRGVDYLGYRIFKDYTLLRKSTYKNYRTKMTAIKKKVDLGGTISYSDYCSINSYKGWLKHCNSFRLQQKYSNCLTFHVNEYYNKHIKKEVS